MSPSRRPRRLARAEPDDDHLGEPAERRRAPGARGASSAGSAATASRRDPATAGVDVAGWRSACSTATSASIDAARGRPRRAGAGAGRAGASVAVHVDAIGQSAGRSRRSRRRTPSCTTVRLTFSDGVSSPVASVKSTGQDPEHPDRLGLGDGLVGVVDRLLDLGAQVGSSRRSATVASGRLARRRPASAGSASSSMVTSAAMNGCRSPTTTHWLTSGWARTRSSSTAGATFLPPAVTMISFLRPVIVR